MAHIANTIGLAMIVPRQSSNSFQWLGIFLRYYADNLSKSSAFLNDKSGATAIEYGLIATGIAIAIIAAVNGVGTNLSGTFSTVASSLK